MLADLWHELLLPRFATADMEEIWRLSQCSSLASVIGAVAIVAVPVGAGLHLMANDAVTVFIWPLQEGAAGILR